MLKKHAEDESRKSISSDRYEKGILHTENTAKRHAGEGGKT